MYHAFQNFKDFDFLQFPNLLPSTQSVLQMYPAFKYQENVQFLFPLVLTQPALMELHPVYHHQFMFLSFGLQFMFLSFKHPFKHLLSKQQFRFLSYKQQLMFPAFTQPLLFLSFKHQLLSFKLQLLFLPSFELKEFRLDLVLKSEEFYQLIFSQQDFH